MISAIIPVLNESECVRSVIEFAKAGPNVDELLIVDDSSVDGTPERAKAAGQIRAYLTRHLHRLCPSLEMLDTKR